jgi:AcrR family transcriptional regulator
VRPKTPDLDHRILNAAAKLFAGNHFHEVRMEDISTEANVGKGTLYRYFRDKEELYLALLERAAFQIEQLIDTRIRTRTDLKGKLIALTQAVLDFFDEQPHLFELIQQAEARLGTNHPWQPARDYMVRIVVELFREAHRINIFRIANPEVSVLILLGGLRAVFRFGSKPRPQNVAEQIVDTVLNGAIIKESAWISPNL